MRVYLAPLACRDNTQSTKLFNSFSRRNTQEQNPGENLCPSFFAEDATFFRWKTKFAGGITVKKF
jgi:hypothetical protein